MIRLPFEPSRLLLQPAGAPLVSLASAALRVTLALPFWRSGLTKWDGFLQLSASTRYLFAEEFRLHLFGGTYAFPAPHTLAFLSASGEILFPILLVLGLGTRLAALGILAMTAVIQLTFPDGWMDYHLPWAVMALAILALGPGRLSLDWLGARWLPRLAGKTLRP